MNTPQEKIQQLPAASERQGLVQWAGQKFGVDAGKVFPILKQTCFKGSDGKEASDAEVAALMIVSREHVLNPFLKEIFAFPDKKGGIVPVVGVDGWIRIINSHPQFNGMEFTYEKEDGTPAWIECHIFRKDRNHPIKVREFMSECKRDTGPWKSHPSRMLRHKALIQCARVAFGFAGIYDEDEAERIIEGQVLDHQPQGAQGQQRVSGAAALKSAVGTSDHLNVTAQPPQAESERAEPHVESDGGAAAGTKPEGTQAIRDDIVKKMQAAKNVEKLDLERDQANLYGWTKVDLAFIDGAYKTARGEIEL